MECPHCLLAFTPQPAKHDFDATGDQILRFKWVICPGCNRPIIEVVRAWGGNEVDLGMIYPKRRALRAVPNEVPPHLREDYTEAATVLADSEKASAALSRRCLQIVLREKAGVKPGNLSDEIDHVIESRALPSHLADAIDAVRHVGNFAAHPMKSKSTGEIVEVEAGEAQWLLDTLEGLFDFYFVQPARLKDKRDALNTKLRDAGKPELK